MFNIFNHNLSKVTIVSLSESLNDLRLFMVVIIFWAAGDVGSFDIVSAFLEIAESIEVHPATVSRAVASKYVQTPHGLIELRTFFTTGYTTESGKEISNTGIRETIQQMIADENPQKPLSDSAIEKILKEKGIKVARRTIAKYRDQLNILPSHLRKKF